MQVQEHKSVNESLHLSVEELYKARAHAEVTLRERDELVFAKCEKIRLLEEQYFRSRDETTNHFFEEDKRMFLAKNEFLKKVSSSAQKEYNDLLASNDVLKQRLKTKFKFLKHDNSLEKMFEMIEQEYESNVSKISITCSTIETKNLELVIEMGDKVKHFADEKKVFENKISKFEKDLAQRVKDFDDVKTELSRRTDKFETPGLSKSVNLDILFDIVGCTLLLGRAEFCLTPVFRQIKKLEKNKAGLEKAAKGKAAQPSDKSNKDNVTIGHLGELVPDKVAKGKATQPSDKGDKVSVTIRDLAWDDFPWGEHYWEEFHNKVMNLIDKRKNNVIELKKENPSKLPTYTIHGFFWALKASLDIGIVPQQLSLVDSNPTTKLQPTDAEMGQNWYRKPYDCLDGKEKSVQLDDFDVVFDHDDESDAYTE
nr:phospholipase-like protein [Tanacetum cinerariifolium]